ncbi:ArsR/SmtB family transcription factor [Subtercola vilae]
MEVESTPVEAPIGSTAMSLEFRVDEVVTSWKSSPMDQFATTHRPLYEVKANLFKGLAHPVRIRVLEVLSASPDVSVSALLTDTGLEASHLSQHLSVLRRHNLVVAERRASQVFYRLAYPQVADLLAISRALLVEILHNTQQQLDSTVNLPGIPVSHAVDDVGDVT